MDWIASKKCSAAAAAEILSHNPGAKIMLLTSFATATEVKSALDAGVLGAVVKDCSSETLIDAIRRIVRGEKFISQEIADTIAERIGISNHGVKAHLAIVFDRLGVSSRTEATSIAISLGLI